jgi:hypothetical protein
MKRLDAKAYLGYKIPSSKGNNEDWISRTGIRNEANPEAMYEGQKDRVTKCTNGPIDSLKT